MTLDEEARLSAGCVVSMGCRRSHNGHAASSHRSLLNLLYTDKEEKHVFMHLMEEWNPGAPTLKRLKSLLTSRVEAYIATIVEMETITNVSNYWCMTC